MDVALFHPLSVGVVRWSSPDPQLTVIAKVTFSLEGEGDASLADEQVPLSLDVPSPSSPDELSQASDFAPAKPRADVLLVGNAHAPAPTLSHPVAFFVGPMTRRFVAMAGAPCREFPLSAAYLRERADSRTAVSVGPRSPHAPERRARAGARPHCDRGLPCGPYGEDFDFGFFHAAPAEQQIDRLPADVALAMDGLLRGAPRRVAELPGLRPLIYLVDESVGRVLTGVPLRCDTLVIDTNANVCTLVWRGPCLAALKAGRPLLFAAIAPVGTRYEEAEILKRIPIASRAAAMEPVDLTAPGFGLRASQAPRSPGRTRTDEGMLRPPSAERVEPTPRGRASTMVLSVEPAAPPPSSKATMPAEPAPRGRATTLVMSASEAARSSQEDQTALVAVAATSPAAALPFGADRPPTLPPPGAKPVDRPARSSEDDLTVLVTTPAAPPTAALPFGADRLQAPSPPVLVEPKPALRAEPMPPPPSPRAEAVPWDDELSLTTYVAVKAALWSGVGLEAILERHGLDESTFRISEKRLRESLRRDAKEGRFERMTRLGDALRRAASGG